MESDQEFQGYEVDPGEAGYDDEAGYYEGEPGAEGYDDDMLAELGVIDEYGEVDEDALAEVIENLRATHNDQATLAQLQQDKELEQVANELEHRHPVLRDESGVAAMLDSAAELLGYEGDPQDLLEYTVANPQLVEDAVEHMEGAGIFQKLWKQSQGPANHFWGAGGMTG
jgi:hypothetical protein